MNLSTRTMLLLPALMLASASMMKAQTVPAAKPSAAQASPQKTAPAKPVPAGEEAETKARPGNGSGDGIKVHGHWVLQVKNVDGTLGERREFDNALVTSNPPICCAYAYGSWALTQILVGHTVVTDMAIALISGSQLGQDVSTYCAKYTSLTVNGVTYTFPGSPAGVSCFGFLMPQNSFSNALPVDAEGPGGGLFATGAVQSRFESGTNTQQPNFGPNPQVTLSGSTPLSSGLGGSTNVNSIVLTGTWVMQASYNVSNISAVQTYLAACNPGFVGDFFTSKGSPSGCYANDPSLAGASNNSAAVLTSAQIPGGPIPLIPGQGLFITFTLSFA